MSCTPPAPPTVTSPPVGATVQAAATEVGGAVRAVATVQGGVAQPTISAAQTQVVSSGQAAATAVAPTVQAARTAVTTAVTGLATQVAPTVAAAQAQQATSVTVAREATATALAPTAQAVATFVAPTVQAIATQVVGAAGTSVAESPIHVTNVTVGATDTTIALQNSGSSSMNLSGWTLVMGPNLSVTLSDITVKAGQTRLVHFSQGTDTESDIYIGFGSGAARVSLQPGARVVLIAPPHEIASVFLIT